MDYADIYKFINFVERLGLDIDDCYDAIADYVVKPGVETHQCYPNCPVCRGKTDERGE